MSEHATSQHLDQLLRHLERATSPAAAAKLVVDWLENMIFISLNSSGLLTRSNTILSTQLSAWLKSGKNREALSGIYRLDRDHPLPNLTSETLILLIPLHYGGADYGLMGVYGDDSQAVLLGALLAARLHTLEESEEVTIRVWQQQTKRYSAASRVSQAIIANFDLPNLLDHVTELIQREFGFDSVQILRLSDNQREFIGVSAYTSNGPVDWTQISRSFSLNETSFSSWVVGNQQALVVNDVKKDKRFRSGELLRNVGSEMVIPMKTNDEILGIVVIQSLARDAFSTDDLEVLQNVADQLAIAVYNARMFGELRARAQDMAALTEVSLLVNATLDTHELARRVYESVMRVQSPDKFQFAVYDRKRKVVQLEAFEGEQHEYTEQHLDDIDLLLNVIIQEMTPIFWRNEDERAATARYFKLKNLDQLPSSYLGIPMIIKEAPWGALCSQSNRPNAFDENDLQVLLTFANSAAVAIENAELFHNTARRVRELAAINEISVVLARQFRGDDIWQPIHEQLAMLFETSSFYIAMYDRENRILDYPLISQNGIRMSELRLTLSGVGAAVVNYGTTLHFRDLTAERERLQALKIEITGEEPDQGMRSWIGVPFRNRRRESIGVISIYNVASDIYTDDDLSLLTTIAAQISLALDNALLLESEQDRRRVANTLMDVGRVVSSTLDIEEVLERVLEQMARVIEFDSATIMLPASGPEVTQNEDGSCSLIARATSGASEAKGRSMTFKPGNPILKVYETQQPLVIGNVQAHEGWEIQGFSPITSRTHAWIGVPMISQNRMIGIITLDKIEPNFYTDRDASTALALARQARSR